MITPYPALFQPLTIGHLRLKNRIMSTSHAPAYAEDGMPKERYRRYHEEKAKGGARRWSSPRPTARSPSSSGPRTSPCT